MDRLTQSTEETRLRKVIAVATRMLNHQGILGCSGHILARLPGSKTEIVIQTFDQSRAEVSPEDLVIVDLDGHSLLGRQGVRPPDEVAIHTEILRVRDDVNAVFHFHPPTAVLFTMVEGAELKPVDAHAFRWASGIPVHPEPAKICGPDMGAALAATLGHHNGALLRAHGAVLVAESVEVLTIDAIHFCENAEANYRAAALGQVLALSPEDLAAVAASIERDKHTAKLWDYYTGLAVGAGAVPNEWI
ncbi:MAG: class II aldolase/adducin family protein [Pseudomonadota bacterium]|nr:class II aldolase/adducin family protein [Pseudomonadota bacterium]